MNYKSPLVDIIIDTNSLDLNDEKIFREFHTITEFIFENYHKYIEANKDVPEFKKFIEINGEFTISKFAKLVYEERIFIPYKDIVDNRLYSSTQVPPNLTLIDAVRMFHNLSKIYEKGDYKKEKYLYDNLGLIYKKHLPEDFNLDVFENEMKQKVKSDINDIKNLMSGISKLKEKR